MNSQIHDQANASLRQGPDWDAAPIAEEQVYRAGAYRLLASLLRDVPERSVLEHVMQLASIKDPHDELATSMSMLGLAATETAPQRIDDEYHALFIGLGRGELLPYGSWYLTGYLMETPLARLRDDLIALGYERSSPTHEPEDHVAALCEVMAMMISDAQTLQQQAIFFDAHLARWLDRFFRDLSQAKNAVFYRAVGRFGKAFIELEHHYLTMKV